MRLTLRTMLAFLDDILDPNDAQEISHKINESKFATDLVQRIRQAVGNAQLSAPAPDGPGSGIDPNAVAEYLDNTLPPEKVPEFEKICLASDVHLAEVAACHQVLTLVFREHPEIVPELRERIYQLGRQEAADRQAAGGDGSGKGRATGQTATSLADSEPPGARRPAARRAVPLKSLAITLVCTFALVVVALLAMGPFNSDHPLWKVFRTEDVAVAEAGPETAPEGDEQSTQEVAETTSQPDTQPPATESSADEEPREAGEADDAAQGVPQVPEPADAEQPPVPTPPGPKDQAMEASEEPQPEAPEVTQPEGSVTETAEQPAPSDVPGDATAETPPAAPAPGESEEETETPTPVGRYISEEQMLARWDGETKAWLPLAPDTPLAAGDQLLSLLNYRPQLLVAPNIKLTLAGATRLQLGPLQDDEAPEVAFDFGRCVLVPSPSGGGRLHLRWADVSASLELADAASIAALSRVAVFRPGVNPLENAPSYRSYVYCVSGQLRWSVTDDAQELSAGQSLLVDEQGKTELHEGGVMPDWIEGRDLSELDRRAAAQLRQFLLPDRPLSLSLLEMTEYRQTEVRALACRNLTFLDHVEPLLQALNDEMQHSYWADHFDTLQATLARGPETARQVKRVFDDLYGQQSDAVFRLTWGFSPEQLEDGGAKRLVDFLEHPQMAARVLAFENLRRITGKTFLYRPEQSPLQERVKITKWRRALELGEIRYPTALPPAEQEDQPPPAAPEAIQPSAADEDAS